MRRKLEELAAKMRRERGVNFMNIEKQIVMGLIDKYKSVIENKKSDGVGQKAVSNDKLERFRTGGGVFKDGKFDVFAMGRPKKFGKRKFYGNRFTNSNKGNIIANENVSNTPITKPNLNVAHGVNNRQTPPCAS
ncbi:hypothetical protein C0J52_11754 [Blattella germanica]|nr:hypothetical protein C0J52_11754 [Blattella germanica]